MAFSFFTTKRTVNTELVIDCYRDKETTVLKEQINKLQAAILREEEKAKDLKLKAQLVFYAYWKNEHFVSDPSLVAFLPCRTCNHI